MQDAFNSCLCLLMVELGKMRLVDKAPDEYGTVCAIETRVEDRFSVVELRMNKEQKATLIDVLPGIVEEEGN